MHEDSIIEAEVTGYDPYQLFCQGIDAKTLNPLGYGIQNTWPFFFSADELVDQLLNSRIILKKS